MPEDDLVRMANQIAANLCYLGPEEAATRVAAHLKSFWAPSMRVELLALAAAGDQRLSPVARAACRALEPGAVAESAPADGRLIRGSAAPTARSS